MRINHNISALKANNQLGRTNKLLDKSLERLSSGYRINRSADDSAGLAISEKMRTQIAGLEQASRNAADGISVIQTAEGALIEVEAMLQRMRELAVQSANGTYTSEDRKTIQTEIDQLSEEIARISKTTEFNTMTLLDGSVDRKSFSDNNKVSLISLSDSVAVGDYQIKITQDASQALIIGNETDFGKGALGETGLININGESIVVNKEDTIDEVFQRLRDACDNVGVDVFAVKEDPDTGEYKSKELSSKDKLAFISREYGSQQEITIHCDNEELSKTLGLTTKERKEKGVDAKAEIIIDNNHTDGEATSLFNNTATVSVIGNKVNVTDREGFNMVFELKSGIVGTEDKEVEITVSVLDAGPMDLQIGANEGQLMQIRIPKVTPKTLGIDKVNIGTAEGSQKAIGLFDTAINMVSEIRSKLGAYQNRLEHSISNLDVSHENMTESLSRIKDVDMAEEMAEYTQKNVLAQVGTAMLAQANQRPQTILSLIQQ